MRCDILNVRLQAATHLCVEAMHVPLIATANQLYANRRATVWMLVV
jgi:hypothetical protein